MSGRVWILGAADPEMEAIEALLRECGERVVYALDATGERVRPGEAYRAWDGVPFPPEVEAIRLSSGTIYAVECDASWYIDEEAQDASVKIVRIDHHRPGDPGYGRPPAEFLAASSLGQVITWLAARSLLPVRWGFYGQRAPGVTIDVELAYDEGYTTTDPDVYEAPGWVVQSKSGASCEWRVPSALVLTAAADHCLGAAYRGECTGVDPDALMQWRVTTRAAFQRRPVEELRADIERAREALRVAQPIGCTFRPHSNAWCEGCGPASPGACIYCDSCTCGSCPPEVNNPDDTWCFFVRDLRGAGHIPELVEAATRDGVSYITQGLPDGSGRAKVVCSGTSLVVEAFIQQWAPQNGLVDIYGDPQRGFAGGYLLASGATTEAST